MFYYDKEKKELILPEVKYNPDMRDYSKEPYCVKKNEKAKAFLGKAGLPKEWEESQNKEPYTYVYLHFLIKLFYVLLR